MINLCDLFKGGYKSKYLNVEQLKDLHCHKIEESRAEKAKQESLQKSFSYIHDMLSRYVSWGMNQMPCSELDQSVINKLNELGFKTKHEEHYYLDYKTGEVKKEKQFIIYWE